ncbi:two-partner secretion domain-containing protein [Burkholderia glumae]|uniref:two-partner secretion domain-containing protein n=1 Tax=Burkholderia glumae TaxID=337 RepID=UPI00148E9E5D|nr:filamentous hemagglutinin N-terminal domain-containing protein [Burkholderia glumae]QJW79267.1 filamentous hemagglutinin N-terminal domain-containing protein [Burkholderia glumae]
MNKHIHRVIFNAARGLWMAVEETATGAGKGRSTGVARRGPAARASWAFVDMLSMRHVAFAALCALGMQAVPVDAQVVAAPGGAGSRPLVGVTANGLPIVQIATPNAAGVSNNGFTQYNVGTKGLILNNSQGNVLTQQAGYVTGNPNLVAGTARVIVNQVVGGNPSQLLGYTEVAGQKAEVVIANPAGIYCNGCGFINTSRGILTTGTPSFGGTGSLDAFHVTGGQIQVGPAGLDGSNVDQVDLIARSVAINGKVWAARSLNVVAGNNDVRHDDLAAQSLGADGNAPGVAIDVSQLGGMYAGKIRLVGTEAGVGVNSAGSIAAQGGDVVVNSQGRVTLAGTTSASGNVAITAAGDVANGGTVYAQQAVTVASQGQIGNSGTIAALGNTTLAAASVVSGGTLGAGVDAGGNLTGSGSLTVTAAGAVSTTGHQSTGGDLVLTGSSLALGGATTSVAGNATLTANGAAGDGGNLVNAGATLRVGGALTADAAGTFSNDRGALSTAQLSVNAGALSNRGGTLTQTGAAGTSLVAAGSFDNGGGAITTNAQSLTVRAGKLANVDGRIEQAGNGTLSLSTGALDNTRGRLATNGSGTLAVAELGNASGSITVAGALGVASRDGLDNSAGRIEAGGALNVSAVNLQNAAGRIVADNAAGLTLSASGSLANAAGTTAQGEAGGMIGSNGDATVHAGRMTNSGTVTAANHLALNVDGLLDNSGGALSAATLAAQAASLRNANGVIGATDVSIAAPQFDNSSGRITANTLGLAATTFVNEHGAVVQMGAGTTHLDVAGALDNANGGLIQADSTDLTLAPASLDNDGGAIRHAGAGTLAIDAGSGQGAVSNAGGTIVSNGTTQLAGASLDNTGGTIGAQAGLGVTTAGTLDDTRGTLVSNADLSLQAGGALTNTGGSIKAGQNLTAHAAGHFDNGGGKLGAHTLTATAASFANAGGSLAADTLSLAAQRLDNGGGAITANHLGSRRPSSSTSTAPSRSSARATWMRAFT